MAEKQHPAARPEDQALYEQWRAALERVLTAEITEGTTNVEKALQREAMHVRASFNEIVGNASATAEEAVTKAEAAAGLFPAPGTSAAGG